MALDFLDDLRRTHTCGELRAPQAGERVVLMGWVNRRRDLGSLIFVDVRDRTGITQVVFNAELNPALHEKAAALRSEYVVAVLGKCKRRDPSTVNLNIETGEVEIVADELKILNESKTPPFLPSESVLPNEEVRLQYRYIDLRRPPMQANIELRHRVTVAIRNYLAAQGFLEIETPFMTRSTPEGARDYLVPSRVQPGKFYALPQSPQLFKQILMIAGFDKYFQIVRCFRDEDLRADRQPEFTQIDLEMSFPQPDRVFEVVEGFLTAAFKAAGTEIKTPFRRMTYDQAIRLYGSDKPDMRLPAMTDVRSAFTAAEIATFASKFKVKQDLPIYLIRIPSAGEISGTERRTIGTYGGFLYVQGPSFVQLMSDPKRFARDYPGSVEGILASAQVQPTDLWVLAGALDTPATASQDLRRFAERCGLLRFDLAQKYADKHGAFKNKKDFQFLWVTDFPMFDWDDQEKRWAAAHHPFTSPHEQDMEKLESDPAAVRALAYDVVLNGTELGSGSIRIHRQDIQKKIFRALGMSDDEARARFGFFLEALEYGTPPHGGIALGLDRIVMLLAGADSLREVIPFPKTAKAVDLMVDAPSHIEQPQENELELMSAWWGLEKQDWELAYACDEVLSYVEREVFGHPLPYDTAFQRAMNFILARAVDDARGAVHLAKAGYGVQAGAVCRSLLEGAINASYIAGDPEARATEFLGTIEKEAHHLARSILAHGVTGRDHPVLAKGLSITVSTTWPRTIQERIEKAGEMRANYKLMFAMLSQLVHPSINVFAERFERTKESQFSLRIGRGREGVELALVTVFLSLYQVASPALNAFGHSNEQLEALLEKFKKLDPLKIA
jgi:aspartyl-tRNA synthetase